MKLDTFLVLLLIIAIFPSIFLAVYYGLSYTRVPEESELKARKRWNLIRRSNTVFFLSLIAGLIYIGIQKTPVPSSLFRVIISLLFIIITFFPFVLILGIVDRKIRGVSYSLSGCLKFQTFFFFSRFTALLVILVFCYFPFLDGDSTGPIPSFAPFDIVVLTGALVSFILMTLFQMRIVGGLTGAIKPIGDGEAYISEIGELSKKAGIDGVSLFVIKTFGYPFFNAFAAPFKRLYFTESLLNDLDRKKLIAVAAHEIGHLKTMKRRTISIMALYILLALTAWIFFPLMAAFISMDEMIPVVAILVLLAFSFLIISTLSKSRKQEEIADKTAADLTGDPEDLVSALERIYELNMVPRRFDKRGSEEQTHPSLERRVAKLRGEDIPKPKRLTPKRIIIVFVMVFLLTAIFFYYLNRDDQRYYLYQFAWDGSLVYQSVWVELIRTYEMRLERDPSDFDALKGLAVQYYLYGYFEDALLILNRCDDIGEDHKLLTLKGILLYFERDDLDGAIKAMEGAYEIGGTIPSARWAAYLNAINGDKDRAKRYIREVLSQVPDDAFSIELSLSLDEKTDEMVFPGFWVITEGKGGYVMWY